MKTALSAKIGKKIKEKRLELKLTIHEISNEINLTEKIIGLKQLNHNRIP